MHETLIWRELSTLERQGLDFNVCSVQYPRNRLTLADTRRLMVERTTYSPLVSAGTLAAPISCIVRRTERQALARS